MSDIKICILSSKTEITHTILFSNNKHKSALKENAYYSEFAIHSDDSIRTIKMKLLHELHKGTNANKIKLRPSYEELYLYGFVNEKMTTLKLFDALKTEAETDPLIRRELIHQMLEGYELQKTPESLNASSNKSENAVKSILQKIPKGDKIPYSAFESALSETEYEISVKTPLGIIFAKDRRDFTFEVNPFLVETHRAHLLEHNNLHYFDDSLLLNYGLLVENTIYVCLASDVYDSVTDVASDYISRYYYPGLYRDGVKSKTGLIDNRETLIKNTQKLITNEREQYYKSVDLFYEISADNKTSPPVKYINKGIEKITLRLINQTSRQVNLETIFKNMHCSKDIPYIKFNPGNRRENLYRLFFERTTRNGKKIPYLS